VLSDDEKESLAELKRNARDEDTLKFVIDHCQVLRKNLKGNMAIPLGAL
jgi:hypothetical protein